MPAKNDPREVMFKGDHPYFEDGTEYTYKEYSRWTKDNCEHGGVKISTMKSRLRNLNYCENDHLLSPNTYLQRESRVVVGWREIKQNLLTQSRLTEEEELSQEWLCKKLVNK